MVALLYHMTLGLQVIAGDYPYAFVAHDIASCVNDDRVDPR
jgi:hypothetical protein